MSKLDELIAEFCPDGVEFVELNEVLDYEQPTKYIVKSTNYDDSYTIPVLTAGQSFVLGYTNEDFGIYKASPDSPVIIFDDFTTSFHWVDFNFKVKSSAMKMLRSKDNEIANLRFLFHLMKNINYIPVDHSRQWIGKYSKFRIPLPPLPVQQEIVRILDNFTELKAELKAELTARRKQYEYYRDLLLTMEDKPETKWMKLGEIADFRNGKGHEKAIAEDGKFIVVNSKFISTNGQVVKFTNQQISPLYIEDILIVMSDLPNGKALAKCFLVDENNRYTLNQRIGALRVKNKNIIDTKFLYYFLNRNRQLLKYDNGVDQTNLKKNEILSVNIPIIPLKEQKRIVAILDRFDALCNDLTTGLPAEIEARQKQYEYYRDKLLSFKEVTS